MCQSSCFGHKFTISKLYNFPNWFATVFCSLDCVFVRSLLVTLWRQCHDSTMFRISIIIFCCLKIRNMSRYRLMQLILFLTLTFVERKPGCYARSLNIVFHHQEDFVAKGFDDELEKTQTRKRRAVQWTRIKLKADNDKVITFVDYPGQHNSIIRKRNGVSLNPDYPYSDLKNSVIGEDKQKGNIRTRVSDLNSAVSSNNAPADQHPAVKNQEENQETDPYIKPDEEPTFQIVNQLAVKSIELDNSDDGPLKFLWPSIGIICAALVFCCVTWYCCCRKTGDGCCKKTAQGMTQKYVPGMEIHQDGKVTYREVTDEEKEAVMALADNF